MTTRKYFARRRGTCAVFGAALVASGTIAADLIDDLHDSDAVHVDQADLYNLVQQGLGQQAFIDAFELGDELFEVNFVSLDGVGANVGQGMSFTRIPRADLAAGNEWANHFPARETGPNSRSCVSCHNVPFDDGAGEISSNVHRDPTRRGDMSQFIQRNPQHMFASGAIQRIAEEMTEDLHILRDRLKQRVCKSNRYRSIRLRAKRVEFGTLGAQPQSTSPCEVSFDTAGIEGVDDDLVVKPFQWKGSERTLRTFNAGAFHNELGMQPIEIVGRGIDGDFDGKTDEITVGDQTAMAIYLAAQARPTTKLELFGLQLINLTGQEKKRIRNGRREFDNVGCSGCHTPTMRIDNPIFSEPSQNVHYRDDVLPSGEIATNEFLDPEVAVVFDLTADQPDNHIPLAGGGTFHMGALRKDLQGRGVADVYGDMKRHDMGTGLAEAVDEVGTGASSFITPELWGVGSTSPYMHDGRATTLTEAILAHGGEAESSRIAFESLGTARQRNLIAFLENLVIFILPEQ